MLLKVAYGFGMKILACDIFCDKELEKTTT